MAGTKGRSPAPAGSSGAERPLTAAMLAKTIRRLLHNADGESVRELVRDFIRRASTWARARQPRARLLAEAIVELDQDGGGALQALLRWLDQADNGIHARMSREFPNLFLRRPNTVARLRLFVERYGSPTAKKALARAFRAVDAPAGADVGACIVDALERKAGPVVAEAIERLLVRFEGAPEGAEWNELRAELDGFVTQIVRAGKAQALLRALERRDGELDRRISTVRIYGLKSQFEDLLERCASESARRNWRRALGREARDGDRIGKQLAELLGAGKEAEAIGLLLDEVLSPLDDRFGGGGEEAARVFNAALGQVHRSGRLGALLEAARHGDDAFVEQHPHVTYVGALHRLRSALDRVGEPPLQEAFREAWQRL
ncbi:MAG: hypothetical protein KatS3mg102_1002 [Planctomycetota bacterium]|nr:MAG: hypothetical protein KatS3mg102_1002 [Planctomycetota bacterium]